ncbi:MULTISPECIES: hypothetical protein [Limnobaculum]|nr:MULTISPECIES: hypothetical protein [Limnobaculum]
MANQSGNSRVFQINIDNKKAFLTKEIPSADATDYLYHKNEPLQ